MTPEYPRSMLLTMVDYMLVHAWTAEELHQAVEAAVDLIEANPLAQRAADIEEVH